MKQLVYSPSEKAFWNRQLGWVDLVDFATPVTDGRIPDTPEISGDDTVLIDPQQAPQPPLFN